MFSSETSLKSSQQYNRIAEPYKEQRNKDSKGILIVEVIYN